MSENRLDIPSHTLCSLVPNEQIERWKELETKYWSLRSVARDWLELQDAIEESENVPPEQMKAAYERRERLEWEMWSMTESEDTLK